MISGLFTEKVDPGSVRPRSSDVGIGGDSQDGDWTDPNLAVT